MHPTLEYLNILSKYLQIWRINRQYNNSKYFNILLSAMVGSSTQKINKETLDLSYTLNQMDLTDMCKTFN